MSELIRAELCFTEGCDQPVRVGNSFCAEHGRSFAKRLTDRDHIAALEQQLAASQAAVARLREALELCRVRLASIRSACEDWRGGVNSEALRDAMRYVPESLAKAGAALATPGKGEE